MENNKQSESNPFELIPKSENNEYSDTPRFNKFYVGIDIGYKFHVATCIPYTYFLDSKEPWKRSKAIQFNSDSNGLRKVLESLQSVSNNPKDFFILMEPTGGHYGYLVMRYLLDIGYNLFQVENKAVKDFRERQLGIKEKSDQIDSRIMAYMGFHKALHPSMVSVRIVTPATPTQILFRTLTRDRWLLNQQLTRRKNQVQQLFAVTNPELKTVFSKPGRPTVLKLALEYPTAQLMAKASEEDIYNVLIKAGAHNKAKKAAKELKELVDKSIAIDAHHLVNRQKWLIEEAQRLQYAIDELDVQIKTLLYGDVELGLPKHPYTDILFTFPTMSETWACTLIGVIGDINRFNTVKEFKKYLGFAAENAKSGTSVHRTRLTYDGVRDTRRVLFQMALILITSRIGQNVFKLYYNKLITGRPEKGIAPIPKMKAIGHVCGKVSQIIYGCLKSGQPYDPFKHALACGIPYDESFINKLPNINPDIYEEKSEELAEEISIEDV